MRTGIRLLLHVWMAAFGDSADAMRAPSVLAMAGAAACVALIGRRLAGNRAGLLAGLVFALVPSVTRFAAACLGAEPRIWVIGVGRQTSPYQAVTPAQAAVLRPRYRLSLVKHQRSLTMFLLTQAGNRARSVP